MILALSVALLAAACGGDGGRESGSSIKSGSSFTGVRGVVTDIDGALVEGAFVNLVGDDGNYMTTGPDGRFELESGAIDEITLAVTAPDGLVNLRREIRIVAGGATHIDIQLLKKASPVLLNALTGGSAIGLRGAALIAEAGAFVTDDGTPYEGNVDVYLTPIDPSIAAERNASPAALDAARDGGETVALESFGMVDVEIKVEGQDEELKIADGRTVTLRVPAPSGTTERPETVPLWNTNWTTWRREGEATYKPELDAYEGEVSHFSTWNCDKVLTATCVKGHALTSKGEPVPGAFVMAEGEDYNGASSATADEEGEFCVVVRQNSTVKITVYGYDGEGTSRIVESWGKTSPVPPVCTHPSCEEHGDWIVTGPTGGGGGGGGGGGIGNGSVACQVAGVDSCVYDLLDVFECFAPSGQCTIDGGGIEWANGASFTGNGFFGPGGKLCGTFTYDWEKNETILESANKQQWIWKSNPDGVDTVTCPNGKEVTITPTQQEAMKQCDPTQNDFDQQACINNTSFGGGACTSDSQCGNGQTCCDYGSGMQFCIMDAACPQ